MIVYEVTEGIRQKAWEMAEIGTEPYGEGTIRKDRSGVYIARITEGITMIHLEKYNPIWRLNEYGYDIVLPDYGLHFDAKAKDRTVPPLWSYDASITEQAWAYQKPDGYIFASLERKGKTFIKCYLIGFCTRAFYEKESEKIPVGGYFSGGNGIKVKKACRNMVYRKLTPIEELDTYLKKLKS